MLVRRHVSSCLGVLAITHVAVGCSQTDPDVTPSVGGSAGVFGSAGAPGGGGASGGVSGSAGSAGSSAASAGFGGSVGGASAGAGGAAGGGRAGASGAAGAVGGGAGASGAGGAAGGGQAGQAGSGGGVAGAGGDAGSGGTGGNAGASGAAGSGGSGDTTSAGCGTDPTLTSGNRTIQSAGQNRSYILRIPDNYDNTRPYRLIFAYHWRGGTMQDVDGGGSSGAVWSYYGLRAQADDSTIFVAPQGIGNGWPNSNGQDLAFTDDMVELIQGDLCVDKTRVFALGFSYGGSMSYALACARSDVFRAVAVYAGGELSRCEGGNQPIAYIGLHGLGDNTLDISGGREMRDRFVTNNGCTPQDPPEPNPGSLTHTCTTYQGCMDGYPVRWCAFDGGHTPGVVDGGGDDGARTWTKTEVWEFFSQF